MDTERLEAPATYTAPALVRLGSLTELTQGSTGAFDDGMGGAWDGSILPP